MKLLDLTWRDIKRVCEVASDVTDAEWENCFEWTDQQYYEAVLDKLKEQENEETEDNSGDSSST